MMLFLQPGSSAFAHRLLLSAVIIVSSFFTVSEGHAQGNLLVTPMRVVFDGQKRAEELNLANAGKDTARYLISFVEIRMNSNGTFEQITAPDSGQQFASKYLRFFPRSVVLGPNEAQVIKLQLTGAGSLSPGEYRSHLYFRAVPDQGLLGQETTLTDSSGISVKLTPVFGITIPVIIRVGETTANVKLSGLSVEMKDSSSPRLHLSFNRIGNSSVYGDITVDYISPQGKITQVAIARGLAVYTPNQQRQIKVPLDKRPGINYHTGKLRVAYITKKKTVTEQLAQAELKLQ